MQSTRTVNGDEVVIVKNDEVAKTKMASNGRGLGSDTFLKAAIAAEHVDIVAHHRELRLIVAGRHMTLSNGQADAIRQTCQRIESVAFLKHMKRGLLPWPRGPVVTSTPGVS